MNCSALFGGVSRPSRNRWRYTCADLLALGHLEDRFHVPLMAMHAAVAQKSHQMQPIALCLGLAQRIEQNGL